MQNEANDVFARTLEELGSARDACHQAELEANRQLRKVQNNVRVLDGQIASYEELRTSARSALQAAEARLAASSQVCWRHRVHMWCYFGTCMCLHVRFLVRPMHAGHHAASITSLIRLDQWTHTNGCCCLLLAISCMQFYLCVCACLPVFAWCSSCRICLAYHRVQHFLGQLIF